MKISERNNPRYEKFLKGKYQKEKILISQEKSISRHKILEA